MKKIFIICFASFYFIACANEDKKATASSYIGVNVPDFKNNTIDSLVILYEEDRASFYKAQEIKDMQSYYNEKVVKKDSYNVTRFYDDVIKILNTDGDKDEIHKFQDYIKESTEKSRAFMSKIKEQK